MTLTLTEILVVEYSVVYTGHYAFSCRNCSVPVEINPSRLKVHHIWRNVFHETPPAAAGRTAAAPLRLHLAGPSGMGGSSVTTR